MSRFLSVVMVCYNMDRELPRTLYSMSPRFQRGIDRDDYEVILVDNGSANPPSAEAFSNLNMNLTVYTMENPTHSPVPAINFGLNNCSGGLIGVCIDGARIVSPGLFAAAREASSLGERSIIATRGRYLGTKFQRDSIREGYNAYQEDALLDQSDWMNDGYRLFDISVFDESTGPTWFSPLAESNALFMPRKIWAELGGYDPAFTSRGGGLVNLDMWDRASSHPDTRTFILLGEATFHQVHGGVATNGTHETIRTFFDEYRSIRGRDFEVPSAPSTLIGQFHHQPRGSELFPRGVIPSGKQPRYRLRRVLSRTVGWLLPPLARKGLRRIADVSGSILRFNPADGLRRLRDERQSSFILDQSPLFDGEWYGRMYPEVLKSGYRPSRHYVRFGAVQRRQPGPLFDAIWYLEAYEDVAASGANPLLHYINFGEAEGRRSRPIPEALLSEGVVDRGIDEYALSFIYRSDHFDRDWYLSTYPDVQASEMEAEVHFLLHGWRERRNPGPNFDTTFYLDSYADVRLSSLNPLVHYETSGRSEGRLCHPRQKTSNA